MAVVPPEKTALLDRLLPENDVAIMTAAQLHQKTLAMQGPTAAREIVRDVAEKLPSHPGTRLLTHNSGRRGGPHGRSVTRFPTVAERVS